MVEEEGLPWPKLPAPTGSQPWSPTGLAAPSPWPGRPRQGCQPSSAAGQDRAAQAQPGPGHGQQLHQFTFPPDCRLLLPLDLCCAASSPLQPFSRPQGRAGRDLHSQTPRKSWKAKLNPIPGPCMPAGPVSPFSFLSRYLNTFKRRNKARRISVKYQKPLFFPQTITTFDIILISSYICYFSTLGTRYRKYKHDLLNQRRHSIPLEKETKN